MVKLIADEPNTAMRRTTTERSTGGSGFYRAVASLIFSSIARVIEPMPGNSQFAADTVG
jgi:hypothetical protein